MPQQHYRVTGPHRVDGHQPGTTYYAAYSAAHEQYLVTAGHVKRVQSGAKPSPKEK